MVAGGRRDDRVQWCAANPNCYMSYSWNNFLRLIFIYHTFGLFWTQQFLVGVVCTTTAGARHPVTCAHASHVTRPVAGGAG